MKEVRKLFEKMYYLEDEKKHKLYTNLQIRITVLVLIFGVIAYYLRNLPHFGLDVLSVLFWGLFAVASLFVLRILYFLLRSFYNYRYSYPPKPSVMTNDIERIKKYYEDPFFIDYEKKEIEKLIENDINALIAEYYKCSLEVNIDNNDKRASYLASIFLCIDSHDYLSLMFNASLLREILFKPKDSKSRDYRIR
jgi:hypothetical protein